MCLVNMIQTVCMKEFDFRSLLLSTELLALPPILMVAILLFYSQILKQGMFKMTTVFFSLFCKIFVLFGNH